jgi:hypothetical protein
MHARHSVTPTRETEPAGNSEKSGTSRACFAFAAFVAEGLFNAADFFDDFDAAGFFVAVFFDADFFEAFFATAFLPAAFFNVGAAGFAFDVGSAFFDAAFDLLFVAAI